MGFSPYSRPGWRSRLKTYAARSALLVCAAILIGYWGGLGLSRWNSDAAPLPEPGAEPRLMVADQDLHLGKVYEVPVLDHSFRVTNPGPRPVTLTRFNACDCLGITPPGPITLQPGEAKAFLIRLRPQLRNFSAGEQNGVPVQVAVGAKYRTDVEDRDVTWRFSYTLLPTIWLPTPTLRLGRQSELQAKIRKTGLIEASTHVAGIEALAPPDWTVTIAPIPGATAPHRYEFTVQFRGPFSPKPLSETIRLVPIDSDGRHLPARELKIVGEIIRDVAATPPEVHHGPQQCGSVIDCTFPERPHVRRPSAAGAGTVAGVSAFPRGRP